MGAIFGLFWLEGQKADARDLALMLEALAHRGPDGKSFWHEGSVGLGHCLLQTTPESLGERQPLRRDGLVITADARIDNREELFELLGLGNRGRDPPSDSDLVLHAYQRWGDECAVRLLGDFAFVVWDSRKQVLFFARDHLGVRPFYYHHTPGKLFAFSTEIKALLSLPQVSSQINETRIGDYLLSLPTDKAITFYRDIFRLPPAHSLVVAPTGLRSRQYLSMDLGRSLGLNSDREYAEGYLNTFTAAVKCRLRSDRPVGSALSGGLDSSSIVCVAREILQREGRPLLKTFSGVFDEVPESDERPYINAVIDQGGFEPHFVRADQISPLVDWEQVLWHLEEPIWTPNLFLHWGLYTAARQQGVRVFLDGFLGDNVVGHGWEYLMDLAYSWRWTALLREIGGVCRRQPGFSRRQMIRSYVCEYGIKSRAERFLGRARARRTMGPLSRLASMVNPEFAKRIDLDQRVQALAPPTPAPPGAARKRHLRDLDGGEIPLSLEISNKIAAAFSLEARYPFADRRLVEFCLATPADQRIQDGRSRMIVRHALVSHLPGKVCWRSDKGDLSHNIAEGLLKFERDRLDEVILGDAGVIEPYCDISALRQGYARYQKHPNGDTIQAIWNAVNLALWLKQAAKPHGVQSVAPSFPQKREPSDLQVKRHWAPAPDETYRGQALRGGDETGHVNSIAAKPPTRVHEVVDQAERDRCRLIWKGGEGTEFAKWIRGNVLSTP